VVEDVLGPGEVPEQEAPPADEAAKARPDAKLQVAGELRDGLCAEDCRRDAELPPRTREREHALRIVVPFGMIRRDRLHESAPLDHQILVFRRADAHHVGIEGEVEQRGDPLGDRQLHELLYEPTVDRWPDEPQLGAQPGGRPEVADFRDHVRLPQDAAVLRRHLSTHDGRLGVGSDDIARPQRLEEGLQ